MKDYLWAIVAVSCFFSAAQTSVSLAGGCCKRCGVPNCGRDYGPHCCCHHCGCNSSPPAPESGRRESAPRPRTTGYVVESAPITYGMMAMPLAFGVPAVPAGYRPESAPYRRESDTERMCEQLSKDVSKLSEEVDKLIKVVDKQGLAIEAIVKKLQEKNVLEK